MSEGVTGGSMLQHMINGSRAVLLRPSVSTFEEFERDDLNWATIYVLIGAAIAAVLGAISFAIQRPDLQAQLSDPNLPPFLRDAFSQVANQSLVGAVFQNMISTLISYFIGLGLVYGLGRLFGGTGKFGELAFDIALYQTPLSVFSALVGVIAIGPLSILTSLVLFVAFIYWVYLTYLSIQSGLNVPGDKALFVMLSFVGIFIVLFCGLVLLVVGLIALMAGAVNAR